LNTAVKYRLWATLSYVLLLSFVLGATVVVGVINAPKIFGFDTFLTNFQSGLLMSQIFVGYNYILMVLAVAIVLFESYEYKNARRDRYAFSFAFISLATAMLFFGYYTPAILAFQAQGEVGTVGAAFDAMHFGSEIDIKILFVSIIAQIVRRGQLLVGR
jgi:hypothetical protein